MWSNPGSPFAILAEKQNISTRIRIFRQFVLEHKKARFSPDQPPPIAELLHHVSDFVMESPDTFVQRTLSFGLAQKDETMIILSRTLSDVLGLSKRSVLNQLEHVGWCVIPLPSEEVTSSQNFFQGLWPQVAFQLPRTETLSFASPAGASIAENPDPDIEPPLGDSEERGTHIEGPFRNHDEVLDVMENVLDQVLGEPTESPPVQPRPGTVKDARPRLTP
jgi:hypothetical protein